MIKNSLFASATLVSLGVFGLISRLDFLAPCKKLLFLRCGGSRAPFLVRLVSTFSLRRSGSIENFY
jgi:hypothetical protein